MGEHLESLCIRVPKVYDWVKREVTQNRSFIPGQIDFPDSIDPICATYGPTAEVQAVLTDEEGNPIDLSDDDAINSVIEIAPFGKRRTRKIVLPDGEFVKLQEVRLSISGFYRVKLTNVPNFCNTTGVPPCVLSDDTYTWSTVQTFYLCAPEGTYPVVHLDNFDGIGNVLCSDDNEFEGVDLELFICLSVQMERDVKIEVEGSYCYPRPEILDKLGCGPVYNPPTCDDIFPGRHHYHHGHDHDHDDDHGGEYEFE
ncbi:hypothetical protein P4561_10245 [Priestia flexa]|uniref:hypothetical protein n=1 Tax=Priestia flexa TaxID=86664 RepID=UPI002E1F0A69|nr:hypothetical protein [Priestia flexa]